MSVPSVSHHTAHCHQPTHQVEPLFPARDYITGDRFVVGRCVQCGLRVTHPPPPPERLPRYYPPGYYGGDRRFNALVEWLFGVVHRRRAERMARGRPAGKVLDVGCGRGLLLDRLRRLGWQVLGTELDERAAHYARYRLGLPVLTGSLQSLSLPDDEFDLVVMWHVLEHLPCPLAVLCEVSRILRPGGLLVLAAPNFASCEARWAGPHWFHLDVPRHLTHFTPRALERSLHEAGLRVLRREHLCIEYDLFSFVQTVQNKAGLPPNLLYNLVRAPSARLRFPGAGARAPHAWQVALALITAVPLGLLSLLYAPLAALLSASGTLTLYAVKLPSPDN